MERQGERARGWRFGMVGVAFMLAAVMVLEAGVVGVFQGRVVLRKNAKDEVGILYVESRQGMARKVRVGDAVIEYDEDVPKAQRKPKAAESLCEDTLVRVTAEQSDQDDGPWRAINILILPEPKRNAIAPGQSFSFRAVAMATEQGQSPGSKGAARSKEPASRPDTSGTSGTCWAK